MRVSEKEENLEQNGKYKGSVENSKNENLERLLRERDEFRDKYLRKLAEMDNYRKMMEREMAMKLENCRAEIIKEFLEPYESLQRAIQMLPERYRGGVELIMRQMEKTLKNLGVEEIYAKGEKFDPMLHDAIGVVDGEDDDIVVEVYQKGYRMNDKILRHAKVLVSKKKEVEKDE
ncbi:molecular chaperone GrpE (heat shock protein) [Aciduliprofundum sp. MAR08-339]|uniref:nucleotide exchange factor GrpE n=1 Tax=Aciduliprofundum sp. (strain MAR08-339) TaxID=673860 RepID=UPI0002A4B93E|nr:molecular chaperone GrpE (heat shock protein) [Aciduliprofundum sp. MAR08-339]